MINVESLSTDTVYDIMKGLGIGDELGNTEAEYFFKRKIYRMTANEAFECFCKRFGMEGMAPLLWNTMKEIERAESVI